jgi:glutamate formiminotransferase
VDNVELLCVDPYNSADIVEMVKRMVEDAGVAIEESAEMDELLLNAVEAADVTNVKGAKRMGQSLVRGADFGGFRPRLGAAEVAAMVPAENKTMKEVK